MHRSLLLCLVAWIGSIASAQSTKPADLLAHDVFGTSSCMGCHGQTAMGGLGPPIAQTKLTYEELQKVVRTGKGMMPAVPENQLSEPDLHMVFEELRAKPWQPDQVPIAFKIGQFLTTKSLAKIFMVVFAFSFLFALRVLFYWLKIAGVGPLWKYMVNIGLGRSAWIVLRALVVDGFCVASLWRRDRFRWLMHGLILYGFWGLILADILLQVLNPSRAHLPLAHPLKMLPLISGIAVVTGVFYVMYRYKKDAYVDNGLTLGRDYLFVTLLFHTVISGFMVVMINRSGAHQYVMPIYLYHLVSLATLVLSAPFTRFAHAWVVPSLVAVTRLTEAVTTGGVEIGFKREPSPGRHHKSERLAQDLLKTLGPEYEGEVRLRYYP